MIMAKKVKEKTNKKKYAGKTEEEWRDWEEKFGKKMDKAGKEMGKKGKEFGEEIEGLAEKFSKHMERKGKKLEKKCKDRWFNVFGPIGPLVRGLFGLLWLMVCVWLLNLVNSSLQSDFVLRLTYLITTHIYYFFLAFLFFAYNDYFSRKSHKFYWMISPITNGVSAAIVLWFLIAVLNLITIYVGNSMLTYALNFLKGNLFGIFLFLVAVGYAVVLIKKSLDRS